MASIIADHGSIRYVLIVDLQQILAEETERLRQDQEQTRLLDAARAAISALRVDGRKRIFAELAQQLQVDAHPAQPTPPKARAQIQIPNAGARQATSAKPQTLRAAIKRALADGGPMVSGEIFSAVQAMIPTAKYKTVLGDIWKMKTHKLIIEGPKGPHGWPSYSLPDGEEDEAK